MTLNLPNCFGDYGEPDELHDCYGCSLSAQCDETTEAERIENITEDDWAMNSQEIG